MRNRACTRFVAVFQAEVLFNLKRVAPYVLIILFGANAVLWWGWGAAVHYGWATNSEYYIVRNFGGFSFLTLPLFTALMMGDPVIRDFRARLDPLIFSKPISRAEYLLGKFFGNFFVLVCCQSAFALTLLLLQLFSTAGMIVKPAHVFPYFKHFIFFVVISHLALAAIYFTVGTLTRNAKIVYALAVSFYPLYIAYQISLRGLPPRLRIALDPLLFNWDIEIRGRSAEWLNQLVIAYDASMIANRAFMILIAVACLVVLYAGFAKIERRRNVKGYSSFSTLNLSTVDERLYNDTANIRLTSDDSFQRNSSQGKIPLSEVSMSGEGFRANLKKLFAALTTEIRLLRAERSLLVAAPLVVFLSTLELAFYGVVPVAASYSATYASNTAANVLIFLIGLTVFYTGEAMHRDRELRIEPVLWSLPVHNYVLLVSKLLAVALLMISLIALVGLTAIAIQFFRGHTPVEISAFLRVYPAILIPSIVFVASLSVFLNALLRDKYLAYALSIATAIGLFYLYGQGYNHPLYNPTLYLLRTYTDLTGSGDVQAGIITHRIYTLAIASSFLSLAHFCFERCSKNRFFVNGCLSGRGWSILITLVSIIIAIATGLTLISPAH